MANNLHPAAAALHLVLTARTESDLRDLAVLWRVRLDASERALIAASALLCCDEDEAEEIAALILGEDRRPLPPLGALLDDARFWASTTARRTMKAHVLAGFEAMTQAERLRFLRHVANWETLR